MDISKIKSDYIEQFYDFYEFARNRFDIEPVEAPRDKQKKIRKWIEKECLSEEQYPKYVTKYIDKDISDSEFFEFMKACHSYVEEHGTWRQQTIEKAADGLEAETKAELLRLLQSCHMCFVSQDGRETRLRSVEDGYGCAIVLENCQDIHETPFDYVDFSGGTLAKNNDEYIIVGEAVNDEEDTYEPFIARFTSARVEYKVFNQCEKTLYISPWVFLIDTASNIISKSEAAVDLFNQKEKALLPLLAELCGLTNYHAVNYEVKKEFPQLKLYSEKLGYRELLPLIENVEKERQSGKEKNSAAKLIARLNKSEYEPLWKELYTLICESQAEYPEEASNESEKLIAARHEIQRVMEEMGYEGTYPDFFKKGEIRGIHLAETYFLSYFVCNEKNVAFHVHCSEHSFVDDVLIQFRSGTKLLKKGEETGDIFSCAFDAKGRRYFSVTDCFIEEDEPQIVSQKAVIATKKAELKKLTKSERKLNSGNASLLGIFMFVFIIMGGLFGIFMTLGFMAIELIAALATGALSEFPSLFMETPWWIICLGCWVLFGATMGVITILASRKK